jgi:prepilin-type N-terminal cleavage/methylation domain-containing protein
MRFKFIETRISMRRFVLERIHFIMYNSFNSKDMLQKAKSPKNKGFTLIELLVVISIISLLSTIVLASLNTARAKARDAVTVQNIKQLTLAMELYKDDNGFYPGQDGSFSSCLLGQGYCTYLIDDFSDLRGALSPYLPTIDFIGKDFSSAYYSTYFFHFEYYGDVISNTYSCDGITTFSEYLLFLPIYDSSGRLTDLPFPKDNDNVGSIAGSSYYCVGV